MEEFNIIVYNKLTHEMIDEFIVSFENEDELKEHLKDELNNYDGVDFSEIDYIFY